MQKRNSLLDKFKFVADSPATNNGNVKPSYRVWYNMMLRCYDETSINYKHYGAKGVTVCNEWKLYSNFEKWYNEHYFDGCQVDKDLSSSNEYSPTTCVMVTKSQNVAEANRRRDYSSMSGINNPSVKTIEHYNSNSVSLESFKQFCKTTSCDINDFIRVIDYKRRTPTTKYLWFKKGDTSKIREAEYESYMQWFALICLKYENTKVSKQQFKKVCSNNNINPEDFNVCHTKERDKHGNIECLHIYKYRDKIIKYIDELSPIYLDDIPTKIRKPCLQYNAHI